MWPVAAGITSELTHDYALTTHKINARGPHVEQKALDLHRLRTSHPKLLFTPYAPGD
jgi:hypothetical protein